MQSVSVCGLLEQISDSISSRGVMVHSRNVVEDLYSNFVMFEGGVCCYVG
jgi:hypothetical protein